MFVTRDSGGIITITFLANLICLSCPLLEKQNELQEDKELLTSKVGTKRKKDGTDGQKSKAVKANGDVSANRGVDSKSVDNSEKLKMAESEGKREAQSKELWALKDELKKQVTTKELRDMLEVNGRDSSGSELDLRDRW